MARKYPQIERLGELLDTSLKRLDLDSRLADYGVWTIWNQAVGSAIARNAQPEKIRNGTLLVKVTSPVWMQQLQFMKEMIAEKLNQRLHCEAVKNIFFVVGRIDSADAESATEGAQHSAEASAEIEVNEEFLASIGDPAIRAAFKKLLKSHARRKPKS